MSVKFVLFDAFGTLVRTHKATHPYRQILKEGIRQGRRPRPDDLHHIMGRALSLSDAAEHFGIKIPADRMAQIQGALEAELDSIEAFEDGIRAVERLQAEGIKIAIASNLAAPYAAPVRRLYPTMDAYGFSFAVGALKPQPFLYRATCELLGAETSDACEENAVLMIGDSDKCDRDGPMAVGIRGFLLNRNGDKDFANLDEFADAVLKASCPIVSPVRPALHRS